MGTRRRAAPAHAESSRPARPRGRPTAGLHDGESVRDYPTLTLRLPSETRALLHALADAADLPLWRFLHDRAHDYLAGLPPVQQRAVRARTAAHQPS